MNENKRGLFISFEGGEGAGKTSLVTDIKDLLDHRGIEAITTREPGGTPGAELIRDLLVKGDTCLWDSVSEAFLVYAARRDHVMKLINPALEAGKHVLCDRFSDSSLAYQGHGCVTGDLDKIHAIALDRFKPDLTFVLDIDSDIGLFRANKRMEKSKKEDRFEHKGRKFHQEVRRVFQDLCRLEPERCILIDANSPQQEVKRQVVEILTGRYKWKLVP